MGRYTIVVLAVITLLTTTQGFSWGRVFNNEDMKNKSDEEEGMKIKDKVSQERHAPMIREETGIVGERESRERLDYDGEKSFRAARSEEVVDRDVEESRNRKVEAVSVMSGMMSGTQKSSTNTEQKRDSEGESGMSQKAVLEIHKALGGTSGPEKVEVMGVPRESEHHITDGLADAIAGLMGVYNSLVRSDGREWDSGMRRKEVGNDTMENKIEESTRVGDREVVKKSGGWGGFGVLAGIVLIGGMVVLLVGFVQRERDGVVYPPRGVGYV